PYFDGIASPGKVRLRDPLVGRPSFVLDTHLGRLASYLRMLGFDTLYRNDYSDDELARISHDEKRILLTRDVGLLKRSVVTYGYFVRNTDPRKHLVEVMERFKLGKLVQPFRYCLKCNGLLIPVQKESVLDRLLPDTARYYDEFHLCQGCGQVYWKGSHYRRMQDFIAQVLG
ncbi:MAG: Mut7-C RNAse domain-containing protein, partial [Candidatus Hadarchaeum sp.]